MNNITKYKVVYFYQGDYIQAQVLEDWLNEQFKKGWEFVGIEGKNFIFKRLNYSAKLFSEIKKEK